MDSNSTRIAVQTDGDGGLVIRWHLEEDDAVEVGIGPTSLVKDHTTVLHAEAGTQTARLSRLPDTRHYVSVTPCSGGASLVAAERRVRFEGVRNFRDLGGYPTAEGARVRWGQVFRSDGLHQMTEVDLVVFGRIGLRTLYDLRSDEERSQRPDPVESVALEVVHLGPGEQPFGLCNVSTELDAERVLRDIYIGMLANSASRFGQLLTAMSGPGGLPTAFHCEIGKDRTGMMAALLLSALGVDREAVLDDYELTARWRGAEEDPELVREIIESGIPEQAAPGFLSAPRWAMSDALDVLDQTYGGISAYLCGPAGMEIGTIEKLRSVLAA